MLSRLFREHVTRQFSAVLTAELEQVMARFELDAQGRPYLDPVALSDPRWKRPYSGLDWQVDQTRCVAAAGRGGPPCDSGSHQALQRRAGLVTGRAAGTVAAGGVNIKIMLSGCGGQSLGIVQPLSFAPPCSIGGESATAHGAFDSDPRRVAKVDVVRKI
ncbi:hypothetical protein [Azohydromonas australica]|uniref:hypothetical protein n=1 Tax=Azohydromonas australica TaxID=364039 RepID=UPI0012EBB2BA|nr:hypothetical protein [Azohydromonas australica]